MSFILAFIALAVLSAGAVEVRAAAEPVKMVIGFAALNARIAPLWAAKEFGFFAKNDIDGDVIFIRGAPTLTAALLSGSIQAGYTGGTAVMGAIVGGADLKVLAVLTNRVTYDLVARAGIRTPEDLRGKQIGVTSIGGTNWMGTILGLEKLGLDPVKDKINFIVAGDDSLRTQGVFAGKLDATAVDSVYSRILREKGLPVLAEFSKFNIPIASTSIIFRGALLEKSPQIAESLMKAVLEAMVFGVAPQNKDKMIALLSRRLKVTTQEAEEGYRDMLLGLERKPYPSLDGLKNIQRLMKTRNPRMADLKVEDIVDDRVMRKLDDSGFIDRLYATYGVK
jgi:ABC-type nitrate/sulfonate/bicarbonate transport system substrate-binding protein